MSSQRPATRPVTRESAIGIITNLARIRRQSLAALEQMRRDEMIDFAAREAHLAVLEEADATERQLGERFGISDEELTALRNAA